MSDLHRLLAVIIRPGRVAEELRRRPRWVTAFLVLAISTVVAEAFLHQHELNLTVASLPPSADAADQAHIREVFIRALPLRLAFFPFRSLVSWGATAFLLYIAVRAFLPAGQVRYQQFLALEMHAEVVNVLGLMVRAALVTAAPSGTGFFPISMLTLLSGTGDFILRALLTSINLHTLWYVWIVGSGVSVLCGYKKPKALLFSAAMWFITMGLNLAIIQVIRTALHITL